MCHIEGDCHLLTDALCGETERANKMNINLNAEDVPEGWIAVDDAWGNTIITAQENEEHNRGSAEMFDYTKAIWT